MIPTQTPETPDSPASSHDEKNVDLSRRRLAGLGAGALITLASRPVLAQECVTPSAAASGNLSAHGPALICSGISPAGWVSDINQRILNPDCRNVTNNGLPGGNVYFASIFQNGNGVNWPSNACQGNTGTCNVAGNPVGGGGSATCNNGRLYYVMNAYLSNPALIPNKISAMFAATLLSIRSSPPRIPAEVLTETQLIGMWNEWVSKNYFEPNAGGQWGADQIVLYLEGLQGA